jgi:hypothetical protein
VESIIALLSPQRLSSREIWISKGRKETKDGNEKGNRKEDKQQTALVHAPRRDVADALERVTKGVVVDIDEVTVAGQEAGAAGVWFSVSIAGVDVVKIEAGPGGRGWRRRTRSRRAQSASKGSG